MSDLEHFQERFGLNSRLVKKDGQLVEEVYRVGGRYDREIRRIIGHLEDALPYATAPMAEALRALIRFYETGEEADRIAYDIAWVRDQESPVDTINGFVEVYMDPRGTKGAWEALVYYVNEEKTRKIQTIAAHAQWFEDHMPWEPRFRKPEVLGVTAKAIEVVFETGDSGPLTPIGINLPNDQSIREQFGSKSVSLSNVNEAYEQSTPDAMRAEFSWDPAEAGRARRWGAFAHELSTEMHEVIGHGSGRMAARCDRAAAPAAEGAVLRDRGVTRRPGGALLHCRSEARGARRRGGRGPRRRRVRRVPGTTRATPCCSSAASVTDRRSRRTTCAIAT